MASRGEESMCNPQRLCYIKKNTDNTCTHILRHSPNWPRGSNWQRVPNVSMVPSIVMAVLIWMAFGIAMCKYIITEDIWTMGQNNPPLGSVLIVIFLVLSSTVSFTAVIVYLFNPRNRFRHSSTKLIPGFQFAPMGTQEDVQLSKMDWLGVNLFLAFAITGLFVSVYISQQCDIFFSSFTDIHKFAAQLSEAQRVLYFSVFTILKLLT
ncbi:hypothetical protein OS493_031988 [Desmophyllum pertusum]|uniref:Uncharacterized protein n=1 Tax=Desmophyllum pertusum TaxID=174260 RepID=A0A9W9Z8N5_9CNID|nr:hypothetical protein OS493_031988 [Desmophyllum pertusum]